MKQIIEDMNCKTYEELKTKAQRRSERRIAANNPKIEDPRRRVLLLEIHVCCTQ